MDAIAVDRSKLCRSEKLEIRVPFQTFFVHFILFLCPYGNSRIENWNSFRFSFLLHFKSVYKFIFCQLFSEFLNFHWPSISTVLVENVSPSILSIQTLLQKRLIYVSQEFGPLSMWIFATFVGSLNIGIIQIRFWVISYTSAILWNPSFLWEEVYVL